jgi:hypothetical protein
MRKTSILLGIGLCAVVVSLTLLPAGAAQEVGVGDSLSILIPVGALERSSIVVVTGRPKEAITVGNCKTGEYRPQDVEIVARDGGNILGTTQVIVVDFGYRNDPPPFNGIELAPGTRLGSFGGGGGCGPGYAGYMAHILAQ